MRNLVLVNYKRGSASIKNLRELLSPKIVYRDSPYEPRRNDLIVNWGCSNVGFEVDYNKPAFVAIAQNKLDTFYRLKAADVSIPDFTESREEAIAWNTTVVERHTLTGHSGQGIVVTEAGNEVGHCPLYVKYKKKKAEYRVHTSHWCTIDVQQKRKRQGGVENTKIRNHTNGWVFCHDNVNPPDDVLKQAKDAVFALGLHFGAVDVIWNEHEQKAYVLEVNTAPPIVTGKHYQIGRAHV